jgi:hypothetical protein
MSGLRWCCAGLELCRMSGMRCASLVRNWWTHRFAGDKMATMRRNVLRDRRQAIKAHQLIDGASFGPDTLKALGQAFDEAWQEVVGSFVEDPPDARLRLANALLSIAAEDCRDVQILKHAALQRMALDFRRKAVGAR